MSNLAVGLALGASMHGGGFSGGAPDRTEAIVMLIVLALAALITTCFYPRIRRASDDRVELCFFVAGFYCIALIGELLVLGLFALIAIALGLV